MWVAGACAYLSVLLRSVINLVHLIFILTQGWIPRTGLQYGADFVLYQKHPALAHSDYSVIIQTDASFGAMFQRQHISWHDLQVTNRLTAQVGKRLLLIRLHDPAASLGYDTAKCLDRLSVSEYLVKRWVPESHK